MEDIDNNSGNVEMKTVLFVPGFLADTYSEIEASFVELCARTQGLRYVWLVPTTAAPQTRFCDSTKRAVLTEPVYVPYLRQYGIPYVVGDISKFNVFKNLALFRRIFRRYRIDAVYTQFGFERFWATLLGKALGCKTVWNEHWHSLGTRYVWPKRWFYRFFVDDFIAVSRFLAATLPGRDEHVHVVHNSIHALTSKESAPSSELCGQLNASGKKIVLMVAAFRAEKRHLLALDICERALHAGTEAIFVFLGDGVMRAPFLAEAQRRGIAASIRAPGHVDDVDAYYRAADICMLTSQYEPFGYCVLEAMKHARPIVVFDGGGPSEILRHGDTGVIVPEGDADRFTAELVDLLRDPVRINAMGERACRCVEHEFSRDAWIKTMTETLGRICARDVAVATRSEAVSPRTI